MTSLARQLGAEGSCVGFAAAAALEYEIRRRLRRKVTISPRYIYYHARHRGGFSTQQDTGAHIRDAVQVLFRPGAVAEETWPYRAGDFAAPPPADVSRAVHYRISRMRRVRNAEEMRMALRDFGPVIGGLCLFDSAYTGRTCRTGRIPMRAAEDRICSAAALCFTGFDDANRLFEFRSPWGAAWGIRGYGYVSYAYAEQFLSDAWAIAI